MNKAKKTMLITLIPAALTIFFIAKVLFPAIGNYTELREKFNKTETIYKETKASVEELENNKTLLKEMEDLNNQVADFDIQIPSEFQDEFFLIDLGRFSIKTKTNIIALNSKKEKEFAIKNSEDNQNKKSLKKKKRRKKVEEISISPLTIYEKSFEIKNLGHYNESLNFVKNLENYQRKFIINEISAQISKNDEKNPNPKIELKIEGSTFKSVKNVQNIDSAE